jgi:hypothetical protein
MTGDSNRNYRLIALFFFGYILLNYPLISLFNLPRMLWGFPMLYAYIFGAWLFLIILVIWITHSGNHVKEFSEKD